MQISRRIIFLILIVFLLIITVRPFAREEASQTWQHVRPAVLVFMDGVYAIIRDFVAGNEMEDGIDDSAPGVDFDHVITMERGSFD
jgi:hypothetical protein